MIICWIVSLLWSVLFTNPASVRKEVLITQSLMTVPINSYGLTGLKKPKSLMLAPPPVHLSGPIPNVGHPEITSHEIRGRKYFVLSIRQHIALKSAEKKGNGHPEVPIIIEKPGGIFFIKFPGKKWVDIQTMEADDPLLVDLIRSAGNITPPSPPSNNGNGGGNGDHDPAPFKRGDLVTSRSNPQFGVMTVSECMKYSNQDGSRYWRVSTYYKIEPFGNYSTYSAKWTDFLFYGRVE